MGHYYVGVVDQAFARPHSETSYGTHFHDQMGMTNIAYFTAAAMQGFAANPAMNDLTIKELAEMSVELAHETLQAINNFVPPKP